ncbi:50S ribosomal protein L11 methyltransferase [soil metagenome]
MSEILDRVGYNGIAVDIALGGGDDVVKAYIRDDAGAPARVSRVNEALGHLQAFGLGPIGELRLRALDEEDWLETWKASFTPVRIGSFLVRPSWAPKEDAGDALVLALDPGMAFGTGLHPTTRQCIEALSRLDLAGRSFLDVGTGSGILAVAAGKRGATPIVAVDVDEIAVAAAGANCAANGVSARVLLGSAAEAGGTYDVVVANIVADTLTRIAPDLRARLARGGSLLVAGILAEKEDVTVAALGLPVIERAQHDDWVCLVLR